MMMNFWRKLRAPFHDDWCKKCTSQMEFNKENLFMLPMSVGNYVSHSEASYYINNLKLVNKKRDIPTGYYACGIYSYKCPKCGYSFVKLSIFLPVRDQEKYEEYIYFENGELDDFLFQNRF